MKLSIVVSKAVVLILLAAVVCNCKECDMYFELEASKTYTNTITKSVGPTTSLTTRSLVDTDTSHYMYLDGTNGNDANGGTGPSDAKKTLANAYASLTGDQWVIHIIDSSTYTATSDMVFQSDFGSPKTEGIQAALGQTPTINMGAYYLLLDGVNGGDKILSGCIVYGTRDVLVWGLIDGGNIIIKDNYIYNKGTTAVPSPSYAYGHKKQYRALSVDVDSSIGGDYEVSYNILISDYSANPFRAVPSDGSGVIKNNIVYMNSNPLDLSDLNSYTTGTIYLGISPTLVVDFDQPTMTAVLDGTSGVASLTPNAWVGFLLDIGSGASERTYRILSNTTTTFYLDDYFGVGGASQSNAGSKIIGLVQEAGIYVTCYTSGAVSYSTTVTQNIVIGKNHRVGIVNQACPITAQDMVASGNVIINCQYGLVLTKERVQLTTNVGTITGSENILYTSFETDYQYPNGNSITPDAGMSITSTVYSNTLVPLYFNQQSALIPTTTAPYVDATLGYVKCAYDFRLRQKGKKYYSTDTQIMLVDSPLLGLYTTPNPDEDLNPWEETLTESAIAYAGNITLDYPAARITIAYVPKGGVEVYDLNGNPHTDVDAWKKEFTLDFQSYVSNENIWKLYRLMEDKGVKKFYPRGTGVTLMPNSTNGALTATSTTEADFVPDPLPVSFIPHHWKGFWITLTTTGGTYDYYIDDNDSSTLYLIDKLSVGFPGDGDHLFSIQYILVQTKPVNLQFGQENFTSFLKGGQWEEKGATAAHEYNNVTITLIETENPV